MKSVAAKRIVTGVLILAIAVSGVVGLIAFFNSRDNSTTGDSATQEAPGVVVPAGGGSLVRSGNVVLAYSNPEFASALRKIGPALGSPDTPAQRAAGNAVVVQRDPKAGGVVARAWQHQLVVTTPADSRLQDFIENWIGRGAPG